MFPFNEASPFLFLGNHNSSSRLVSDSQGHEQRFGHYIHWAHPTSELVTLRLFWGVKAILG